MFIVEIENIKDDLKIPKVIRNKGDLKILKIIRNIFNRGYYSYGTPI